MQRLRRLQQDEDDRARLLVWVLVLINAIATGHNVLASSSFWTHIDVWAPAINTALLVVLARIQVRNAKRVKETKEIAKESHEELIKAVQNPIEIEDADK